VADGVPTVGWPQCERIRSVWPRAGPTGSTEVASTAARDATVSAVAL